MKKLLLFIIAIVAAGLTQAQWEPDVRLTNDPSNSYTSYSNARCVAASGDTVHVVWYDKRDGNYEIYYKRSIDGGITWGADTRLTNATDWSYAPSIVVSGSIVHVVWSDSREDPYYEEIYYKRSEDGGTTWGEDTRLTISPCWAEYPSMAISGSVIHVVWTDYRDEFGDYEIYYKRSTDGGLSWEPDVRMTEDQAYSGFPDVEASGSIVHVLWEEQRDGSGEVYYKRSEDDGLTWGPEIRLTNNPTDSWDPAVAVNGSVVHIVWMDDRDGGAYEVYYKRSTDGGITWGPDTRLTNVVVSSEYPTIAVSGDMVHVVWGDKRDMNYEVYYKQSEDAGMTWEEDTRLTDAFGESKYPFVATSDSTVHVIWNESRDGNKEIYYKRNPSGNIVVGIENDFAENSGQSFTISPNPVSTAIRIQFYNPPTGKSILTIRNILGQILINRTIDKNEAIIDVSSLPYGIYFVEIATPNTQPECRKLIIRR